MTPDDELKSVWNAQPLPRQITINPRASLRKSSGAPCS